MSGVGYRRPISNNGIQTLLPGAPGTQASTIQDFFIYESAQVEEVIDNESNDKSSQQSRTANTGRIRIRLVNTSSGVPSNLLPYADPLFSHQTIYPLIGEYVLVFKATIPDETRPGEMVGKYFYIGPINTKRQVTENAHALTGLLLNTTSQENIKNQRKTALGVLTQATVDVNKIGNQFKKQNVNPLKSFEGDVIYQGRYGQSIRFGSSQMVASSLGEQFPNVIIRAGQGPDTAKTTDDRGESALTNESINQDASSIYLVSNQILGLIPATYGTNIHLSSMLEKPFAFDGASILLNSDRVILNSKATSIFMFARKGIHLNSLEEGITFDTAGPVLFKTPNNISIFGEKTIDITSKEDGLFIARRDINISGDRNINIYGNEIFLGGRSSNASPIAMAKPLKLFMYELLRVIMSTSPLVIGPSGLINPALVARMLMVYAKYMVLPDPFNPLWASNDNFVMKTNEQTLSGPTYLPPNQSFKQVNGLGSRSSSDAVTFTKNEINNAGLKQVRRLFDDELTAKL
jgi:hypothetical protein